MTGKHFDGAGDEIRPSDAARHIQRHMHDLTASLFLRRGPFWDAIVAIRDRLKVVPIVNVPVMIEEEEIPAADVRALHDAFIPPAYRTGGFSVSDWEEFLSFCIFYDPPEDRLLDFPAFSGPYPLSVVTERGMSPGMIAPPIATDGGRWVVRPNADTTDADIRAAQSLIGTVQPRERRAKATDDLLAIQCAKWKDLGMTYPQIARRLGYHLSPDEHGKARRSYPVQRLVKRGRTLLGQE